MSMNFFIVDDDQAVRSMLAEIIEDYDLGEVVFEAENGSVLDNRLFILKNIDIIIIDLLMPIKDGIETVRSLSLNPDFQGKIIMLSQVEDKQMISEAYSLGVEYYITKPINRFEVVAIIKKVIEYMQLQRSIMYIKKMLSIIDVNKPKDKKVQPISESSIIHAGQFILTELGMISECGSEDLLDILEYLFEDEKEKQFKNEFPSLKDIFTNLAAKRLGATAKLSDLRKEIKASEQRVRRAILDGLNHLASIGLTDYSNPKFEEYASIFFNFTEIRKKMLELENDIEPAMSHSHINTKKFVKVLYIEAKKRM